MKSGSGERGRDVLLKEDEIKVASDLNIEIYEYISDKISFNRSLKDNRHIKCKNLIYVNDLPSASVVIIFFNEPFSQIMRTVWSVLRTGRKHVLEVLLVDDRSSNEGLNGKIQYYIQTRMRGRNVSLITLPRRSGLIRARLEGARAAKGDVIVFMDAHCECMVNWLPPLLQRILENRKAVVMPVVEDISQDTLGHINFDSSFLIGGFDFSGNFKWISLGNRESAYRRNEIAPVRSPTMSGGLFAIEKNYFWDMGSYDEMMEGWGGENLEMSFRIWQCGGVLETVPCSRVGHMFRRAFPYSYDQNTLGINTARMALVWMDNYAKIFFTYKPELEGVVKQGDIIQRKALREKLQCKSFQWYLKNIYPEMFVPGENTIGHGRIKNPISDLCLDLLHYNIAHYGPLGVYYCNDRLYSTQNLNLLETGELRSEIYCAQILNSGNSSLIDVVEMGDCHGAKDDQEWQVLRTNQIHHVQSRLCLDTAGLSSGDKLTARVCDAEAKSQKWLFEFNQKNHFGNITSYFSDVDPDSFGLCGDENGIDSGTEYALCRKELEKKARDSKSKNLVPTKKRRRLAPTSMRGENSVEYVLPFGVDNVINLG